MLVCQASGDLGARAELHAEMDYSSAGEVYDRLCLAQLLATLASGLVPYQVRVAGACNLQCKRSNQSKDCDMLCERCTSMLCISMLCGMADTPGSAMMLQWWA